MATNERPLFTSLIQIEMTAPLPRIPDLAACGSIIDINNLPLFLWATILKMVERKEV